jgi:hypothetical protein
MFGRSTPEEYGPDDIERGTLLLFRIESVLQYLRRFLVEWIDTGFFDVKSEETTYRSERPLSRAFAPKRNELSVIFPPPQAIQAIAKFYEGELRYTCSGFFVHLFKVVERIDVEIRIEGISEEELHIKPQGGMNFGSDREIVGYMLALSSPDPELIATAFFMSFYKSEFVFRLMRCNKCKVYKVLEHPPQKTYRYGWHCKDCRGKVTAYRFLKKSRAAAREKWMNLAVGACRAWDAKSSRAKHTVHVPEQYSDGSPFMREPTELEKKHQKADKINSIFNYVNASLGWKDKIKRNTITRNLTEIELRAKGESLEIENSKPESVSLTTR